jgi:hypothetical protein
MPSFMIDSHQGGDAQSGVGDGCKREADGVLGCGVRGVPSLLDRG